MDEIIIKTKGMMCEGCENRVKNVVKDIEGVKSVIANYKTGEVIVSTDGNVLKQSIEDTIEEIGYEIIKDD